MTIISQTCTFESSSKQKHSFLLIKQGDNLLATLLKERPEK
jgi:hypothetical protein